MLIDPDPDKIYTKRRQGFQICQSMTLLPQQLKYPYDVWGNQCVANSGKQVRNSEHQSIPTNLRKAVTKGTFI